MPSLERLYSSLVRSGISLITENTDDVALPTVADEEIRNMGILPAEYAQYLIPGSGKLSTVTDQHNGTWHGGYYLKFPTNAWTDGTEDIEATYDYVEQQLNNELPQSGEVPGGEMFTRAFAKVVDEQSNNEFITVKVNASGGRNV